MPHNKDGSVILSLNLSDCTRSNPHSYSFPCIHPPPHTHTPLGPGIVVNYYMGKMN